MKNDQKPWGLRAARSGRTSCLSTVIVILLTMQFAHAVGVGGAIADSYIGQRLSGSIPIFNVNNPDQLELKILSSTFSGANSPVLSANLDRSNGQLAIRISSDQVVNEPYVSFVMEIIDQADTIKKEFILLLNLAPDGTVLTSKSTPYSLTAPQAVEVTNKQVATGDLMGPYEWAQAGNIPDRFGAVIDGQSLWRVARRINTAMGVSVNQLMLALYKQNPEAFSSNSVDSLQAGSFLTIPSFEQVSSVSDTQAKIELQQLSAGNSARAGQSNSVAVSASNRAIGNEASSSGDVAPQEAPSDPVSTTPAASTDSAENELPQEDIGQQDDVDSFHLSGLDESEANNGSLLGGAPSEKSQEIISSLAATVGNLTQELIQKDKKIEFLEGKIAALEQFAGVDANSLVLASDGADTASLATGGEQANIVTEVAKPGKEDDSWAWLWWLLLVLAVLGMLFRKRVAATARELNLFGEKGKVDFGRVKSEQSVVPKPQEPQPQPEPQHPVFSAVNDRVSGHVDDLVGDELEYDEVDLTQPPDEETVLELEDPSILEFNESNMGFDQRFERLLDEKDYDFALELLNFARHNEIEEDRYHCERLRLLQAMNDEDGFYNYYYDIESSISSYDLSIQNRISQLVVDLAQSKTQ